MKKNYYEKNKKARLAYQKQYYIDRKNKIALRSLSSIKSSFPPAPFLLKDKAFKVSWTGDEYNDYIDAIKKLKKLGMISQDSIHYDDWGQPDAVTWEFSEWEVEDTRHEEQLQPVSRQSDQKDL
jgi:hypothetical protein